MASGGNGSQHGQLGGSERPTPERWQIHGNTAQRRSWQISAVTALFAVATLVVAIVGFSNASEQLKILRQSGASRLFGDYLKIAMERPEFADPEGSYESIKQKKESFVAYRAFADHLFYACEEILGTFPGDAAWLKTCDDHVKRHARFICDVEIQAINAYSDVMQKFMRDIIDRAKGHTETPECK